VASQGIIHGGLKYTLSGLLTKVAKNVREMPQIWREALLGQTTTDLSQTRLRSGCCYLWQTDTLAFGAGMLGARFGLQVNPNPSQSKIGLRRWRVVFGTSPVYRNR